MALQRESQYKHKYRQNQFLHNEIPLIMFYLPVSSFSLKKKKLETGFSSKKNLKHFFFKEKLKYIQN